MAQSIFAGFTDYTVQTQQDILQDVQNWIESTHEMISFMSDHVKRSRASGFWSKVDDDFKGVIYQSQSYYNTILEDLESVKSAITTDLITDREVRLLKQIGAKASEFNDEYGKVYHADNNYWHKYGNSDFKVVEDMYTRGRDYFVSLQDAMNAALRLENYIRGISMNNNTTNFYGDVNNSQVQVNTVSSSQTIDSKSFSYDEVMKVLQEINRYREQLTTDLGNQSDEFNQKLDQLIENTKRKEDPSLIHKGLDFLVKVAAGAGSSIAAKGVIALIQGLHFMP